MLKLLQEEGYIKTVHLNICAFFHPSYLALRLQRKMDSNMQTLRPGLMDDRFYRRFEIGMVILLRQIQAYG